MGGVNPGQTLVDSKFAGLVRAWKRAMTWNCYSQSPNTKCNIDCALVTDMQATTLWTIDLVWPQLLFAGVTLEGMHC